MTMNITSSKRKQLLSEPAMSDTELFRVQVNLGQFLDGYKSKVFVSVNPQWKNVRQLHKQLTKMFNLDSFVLMTNNGVYLPSKESVKIIRDGDVIIAMPKHKTSTKEREIVPQDETANADSVEGKVKRKRVRKRKRKSENLPPSNDSKKIQPKEQKLTVNPFRSKLALKTSSTENNHKR